MRFFRSRRLRVHLLCWLLVLLNAGPFAYTAQSGSGKDEQVIQAARGLVKLGPPSQQLESEDGFDAIHVSAVAIDRKIIPLDGIPETSFDPLSADGLVSLCRGSPGPRAIL